MFYMVNALSGNVTTDTRTELMKTAKLVRKFDIVFFQICLLVTVHCSAWVSESSLLPLTLVLCLQWCWQPMEEHSDSRLRWNKNLFSVSPEDLRKFCIKGLWFLLKLLKTSKVCLDYKSNNFFDIFILKKKFQTEIMQFNFFCGNLLDVFIATFVRPCDALFIEHDWCESHKKFWHQ